MTIDQEPQVEMDDSEQLIDQAIQERFVPEQSGVDTTRLTELLAEDVKGIHVNEATVVALIGGAASGKTTLSVSLVQKLKELGLRADVIGTDDYVVGDREYRRERFEGSDPKAKYDFQLMNAQITAIRRLTKEDEPVAVPIYNEATGIAIAAGEENYTHRVGAADVLIVEGDFPTVDNPDFVIFLHVPDEQRLQNRVDRDKETRSEVDIDKIVQNFNVRQQAQHFPITLLAVGGADLLVRGSVNNGDWQYDVFRVKPRETTPPNSGI